MSFVRSLLYVLLALVLVIVFPFLVSAEKKDGKKETKKEEQQLKLPNNVLPITKENTFPNPSDDATIVEPSELTKQLVEASAEPIENPELIKMLNESTVKTTPFTFGYEAAIFLGRWPLHYQSESSSIIWDYEHVNTNELNNRGQNEGKELTYVQQKEQTVKGALMNKIDQPEMIKKLILQKTKEKASFALDFTTKVGANTKLNNVYNVGPKKIGILQAYVPAVNEKGQVVYGDVYLKSKGSHIELLIKNVTKQGIGAWIPIQDHIALTYTVK